MNKKLEVNFYSSNVYNTPAAQISSFNLDWHLKSLQISKIVQIAVVKIVMYDDI